MSKKKIIIFISIFVVLLSTAIFIFRDKLFLSADIKKIVDNKSMDITFITDSDVISIDNTNNDNLEYQIKETNYDTVSSVKQIIKERDYYIDGYKKYISKYNDELANLDQNSEEANTLNELIARFNNGINDQMNISNERINSIISDSVALSDSDWNDLYNNRIEIDKDNKDKLVFVKSDNGTSIYYSINTKTDTSAIMCDISEDYLKYLSLSDEDKESLGVVPELCSSEESTIEIDRSTKTSGDSDLPTKYPSNFGTTEFFNTTSEHMKNQMRTPYCTAFATIASLESYLYKKSGLDFYFSERYAAYKMTRPFLRGRTNDIGVRTDLEGGFSEIEMAKFLAYYGPVYEDEMPMINSMDAIELSEIDRDPVVDVNEIYVKDETSDLINKIKESVYTYGDVAIAIAYDSSKYLYNGNYYNNVNTTTSHAVTVIGWDDNYPKENFNPELRPSRNGALIIKNSYGKEMQGGINGYFYLSYEDASLEGYLSVRDVDFDFSDRKYFYDFGGEFGTATKFIVNNTKYDLNYQAIKINVQSYSEQLTKIKYALKNTSNVEFYLSSSSQSTSDSITLRRATKIGEISEASPGIHTFELDTPIELNVSSGVYYLIMKADPGSTYLQGTPSTSTASRNGYMYVSSDNYTFYDMSDMYLSPMLAAYTDIVESPSSDSTKPKASISGAGVLKSVGESVTLRCSDNVGVTGYYFGTTNPSSSSSITTTTGLNDITSVGLVKDGLTDGTYYLGCRDSKGNYDVDSITIRKFNISNVVEKIDGNKSSHNTNNYEVSSPTTYYIRDGGLVTACQRQERKNGTFVYNYAKDFNPPAEADTLLGYSMSTTGTGLSFDPTEINYNDRISLYMWYERKVFDATITSGQNGTITASTNTQQNNSVTVASGSSNTLSVKYGDKINLTATPSSSYHLDSWSGGYVSGDNTTILGPEVTNNVTISTTFSNQTNYTVTFKNGNDNYGDPVTVSSGNTVSAPSTNPQKDGYTFSHWSLTDGGNAYIFNTPVTSNITLYAVWQINSYTVTFNSKGGSAVSSQTVNHGGKAIKPTNPTKEGYVFGHWSLTDGGTAYNFNTSVTSNITLYAIWEQSEITIIDDSYMTLSGGVIYIKIPQGNNTISKIEFLANVSYVGDWTLYNKSNSVITSDTALLTTGSYIKNGNTEYKIVIYGDIDQDGLVTIKDLYQSYLLYKNKATGLNEYQISAADYNNDGLTNIKDLYEIYKKMREK